MGVRVDKSPSRGSPFGITRLAKRWQTVMAIDGFFYSILTRIMDSFSCSQVVGHRLEIIIDHRLESVAAVDAIF